MRVLYAKNGGALAVEAEKEASFDFLFQHIEFRCGEELTEGDLKTITKLLNRHDARIFAFIHILDNHFTRFIINWVIICIFSRFEIQERSY